LAIQNENVIFNKKRMPSAGILLQFYEFPGSRVITRAELVRFGSNNVDPPTFLIELHNTVNQCEQGVISALANIATGMPLGSALSGENVTGNYLLAAKLFDSTSLAVRVTTVATGTLTFLMCHERTLRILN
jgi:hypothetical protein